MASNGTGTTGSRGPGSGRLLPTVGETLGGVTDDITMVGVVMDDSRVKFLLSTTVAAFGSIVTVVDVVTAVVVDDTVVVVVVVDVFDSLLVVTDVLPSILLDRSPLSMELRASKCSLTALLAALSVLEALGL